MGKIQEMSIELANLISAGEVVSRPASAIKELVENAIDAGASSITVEIQNGGVTMMRVSDDGCGMEAEDLVMSVRRHATSKLLCAEDIDRISTMGFRGEALASIAAVTRLRIISKPHDAELGHLLTVEYGQNMGIVERGSSNGTTVIAEDLFHNVPARRKFLKRDVTEAAAVVDAVERLAVSHPQIAFHMISDGVTKFRSPGNGSLEETVYSVLGRDLRGKLVAVEDFSDGVKISGFIGSPILTKANRSRQLFFVNKRSVISPVLSKAISQAYTSYIPEDKFPVCMLFITLNPMAVDVNVHPAKLEIKFSNDALVFGAMYRAVAGALSEIREIPESTMIRKPKVSELPPIEDVKEEPREKRQIDISSIAPEALLPRYPINETPAPTQRAASPYRSYESETVYVGARAKAEEPKNEEDPIPASRLLNDTAHIFDTEVRSFETVNRGAPSEDTESKAALNEAAAEEDDIVAPVAEAEPEAEPPKKGSEAQSEEGQSLGDYRYYRIIGELYNKYALVEAVTSDGVNKFLMIDKHAAHERMLFERIKKNYRFNREAQLLMFPQKHSVDTLDAVTARLYRESLEGYGFGITADFSSITVNSIPAGMDEATATDILFELIELLKDDATVPENYIPERIERALFTVACKAAIKGGRAYPPEFLDTVVRAVLSDPSVRFCPHGRPVAFEMSLTEIDGHFKR